MRHYATKDFKFYGLTLMLGDKEISRVVPVGMLYKIQWPDGKLSEDSYNLTRAKDNAIKHATSDLNASGEAMR